MVGFANAHGGAADLISRRTAITVLIAFTILIAVAPVLLPRIPQPLEYHAFADRRAWLGVPNFLDVMSNLPFALFGFMGLRFCSRENRQTAS